MNDEIAKRARAFPEGYEKDKLSTRGCITLRVGGVYKFSEDQTWLDFDPIGIGNFDGTSYEVYVFGKEGTFVEFRTKKCMDDMVACLWGREMLQFPKVCEPASERALDWRTFALHGIEPGHCICRIPRNMCTYHK